MRHREVLKILRTCCEHDDCLECEYLGTGICDNKNQICADALEELIGENERLRQTVERMQDPGVDTTVCGYPVRELIAFALLCRREGIEEKDLHDYCVGVENGYRAGWHDFEIAQENMLKDMVGRITSDVKVFSIPEIKEKEVQG